MAFGCADGVCAATSEPSTALLAQVWAPRGWALRARATGRARATARLPGATVRAGARQAGLWQEEKCVKKNKNSKKNSQRADNVSLRVRVALRAAGWGGMAMERDNDGAVSLPIERNVNSQHVNSQN